MQATSSSIQSSQQGPHENLVQRVDRALAKPFRRPLATHSIDAFESARQWIDQNPPSPLILDAGCGVGLSTRMLARQHPDALVIGVDRSADRLGRQHGDVPENALLVRADLVDFWRLAHQDGWVLEKHYLLYPNPYPKPGLLKQRWQGHPVFPYILKLKGTLELRSNWRIYVDEFAMAVARVTGERPGVRAFDPGVKALTPFERKYARSGHALWQLSVDLG